MADMADDKAAAEARKELAKEGKRRLARARSQKSLVLKDLQEAYFFTRPRLSRVVSSTQKAVASNAQDDVDDLATGIGTEVSEDFATEMIAAFFPKDQPFVISDASLVPAGLEENGLAEDIAAHDAEVFKAIKTSNFNAELSVAMDPDASVGTVALMITAPGGGRAYRTEHVPLRELEIALGPYGDVDDRFRVRWVSIADIEALTGDVPLPDKVAKKKATGSKDSVEIVWGWWRDWSKPHDDVFHHIMMIDGEIADEQKLVGMGSVALIVAPFAPDRLHAFGFGPAIKALPDLRLLDVFAEATQDGALFKVKPPFTYPDDGVIDFSDGIEPGKGYPARPGSGQDVRPLIQGSDLDAGFVTEERLEKRIRRKFFADYPEQSGKTPPTATQWVDEMMRAQRRIGTPGENFWLVGPKAIFERFAWLCEKDGNLKPVMANGQRIPLVPQNPATLAQDHQKLQTALKLLEIAKGYFPMTSQAAIDEMATIQGLQKLLKDDLVQFRDPNQVKDMVAGMMSQMNAASGGGAPAGDTNAPQ